MVHPFPAGMRIGEIEAGGVTIHTRVGGAGPAVVMLHGFADTGDMWAPLAAALIGGRTVVVPDLRGMGLSSHPPGGYDKKTQGQDIARVLDKLGIDKADLVTHDIGNMVGYAFAAQFPARVARWVIMDAPLPGIGPWDEILKSPMLWHFNFRGPDMERLVAGRERIYLDRFWNELSRDPKRLMKRSASIMQRSLRNPAQCERALPSSWRSARMRPTTRRSLRRASFRCRSWPSEAKLHSAL
jgi:pimeloyl-ACP methyl ester carboxylesterase